MGKEQKVNSETISIRFYCLRAFAVYSIILAHSCYPSIESKLDVYIFSRLSCVGVATFLFLSGFFLKNEKITKLFPKLVIKILVPLLVCGSLVYFLGMIRSQSFGIKSWINYLVGNGSYLYYCIVFMVIRLLLSLMPLKTRISRTVTASILIGLTILSLELTAFGVLPNYISTDVWFFEYLSPYLNIFNWVGFVGAGMLAKEYGIIERINGFKPAIKVLLIVILLIPIIPGMLDTSFGYFGKFSFVCESCLLMIAIIITMMMSVLNASVIAPVGRNSFSIYLLHYPVLSLLCQVEVLKKSTFAGLIRPALCIIIIVTIFKLSEYILKKVKLEKILYTLVGVIPNTL